MKKIFLSGLIILLSYGVAFATPPVPPSAGAHPTDVTNFDNNLSSADTTVQAALETLDEVTGVGDTTETNQDDAWAAVGGTGTETLITVTYQDATNDVDFVVDSDLHNFSWTNVDATDLKTGSVTQAYDADLAAIAALAKIDGNIIVGNGSTWVAESGATARTSLGLVIGTNVQAYDAELAALAGLTSAANKLPYFTGSETADVADLTAFGRSIIDDADEATFKATVNLEIGTDVQAYHANLAAVAGGTYTGDDSITTVGTIATGTWQGDAIGTTYAGTDLDASNLAQALTFAEGDLIDLSGITMSAGVDEGIALPVYADVAPGTEKYYAAYDAANNRIMVRESGGWVDTSAGSGAATTLNFLVTSAEGSLSSESVFTDGYGIDHTDAGGDGGAYTVGIDTTEISADGSDTWSDGSQASVAWTIDTNDTADNVITFTNGLTTFNDAVTVTDTLTATNGIALGTSKAIVGTTAVTLGDNTQTWAVNSSDWDIDATGVMSGIGNINSDGTVTAATLTDGTLSINSGSITGLVEGGLPNSSIVTADIKDGEVGTNDLAATLDLSGKTVTFGLEASDIPDISATYEAVDAEIARFDTADTVGADWEWQDGIPISFGNDNDWEVVYDETTDDRLEYTHTAGAGADVYWDLNDNAAASTFTIANSDGTYAANLVVDGTISQGGSLLSATYQPLHGYLTDIASISSPTLGDLMYFDGTDWVAFAPGTNGYFLQSQGDGSALTWASGSTTGVNETYGSGWNADPNAPEKDDIYDYLHQIDTDDDGDVDNTDVTDSGDADATWYVIIADGATGGQAAQSDSGLSFNPSTNVFTASGGFAAGATATPGFTALDSGCPGSDKEIGKIYWNDDGTGGDGTEDGDFFIQAMVGGTETTIIGFDNSDAQVEMSVDLNLSEDLEVATGKHITVGSNQWDNGSDYIDGAMIEADGIDSAQYNAGSIDPEHVSSGAWDFGTSVEADTLTEGGVGVPNTGDNLSVFAATTSAQLYGVLSDETGSASGSPVAVFSENPTLNGVTISSTVAANLADSETITIDGANDTETMVTMSLNIADITGDTTALLITAVDNDDANYIPLLIQDDQDGTPDDLFKVDYAGAVTIAAGITTGAASDLSAGAVTLGTVSGTITMESATDVAYKDATIDPADLSSTDYGEFSVSAGSATLDADVVDDTNVNWDSMTYLGEEGQPTAAAVGLASANLDDTDASIEWEDATDLESDGSVTWGNLAAGELADDTVLFADLDDDGNYGPFTGTWDFTGGTLVADGIDGSGAVDFDIGSVDITDVTIVTDGGTVTIDGSTITAASANNPYVVWDETDGQDFYAIADDAGNEWELSRDSTVSQNNILVIAEDGSAYTFGDGGDDDITLTFDNDDTDGTIQRMADEKTWKISNILAVTPQSYDASDQDATNVTLGTEITSSIVLVSGDDDTDNDSVDLQNPTVAGQRVKFVAVSNIDADDTVTVNMTDTTCTGCTSVVMDEVGDSFECVALTTSTWNCYQLNEVP